MSQNLYCFSTSAVRINPKNVLDVIRSCSGLLYRPDVSQVHVCDGYSKQGATMSVETRLCVIEVLSPEAKHLVGSKEGRSWDFWIQTAYASSGELYPFPIEIKLPDDGKAYAPGLYLIPAGSVRSTRKGLEFQTGIPLVPLDAAISDLQALAKAVASGARAPARVAA